MFNLSEIRRLPVILLLCILGLAYPAFAQDDTATVTVAEQINSANALVRQGNFDNAIEQYRRIAADEQDREELNYNQGVALYRKGDLEVAEALFAEAASSDDTSISARSRYNLGNCWYAKALQNVEQDKPKAIEQLREAIEHYRGSLNGNSDNSDARANIELAAKLISKLQEEQKQEEQKQGQQQSQQQQDQQQQDDQDTESENADSQNSESEKSDSEDSQSPEDSEGQCNECQQQKDSSSESTAGDQQSQPSDQSESSDQFESEKQNPSESTESEQSETENEQSQKEESDSRYEHNEKPQSEEPTIDQRSARKGSQDIQPQPAEEQVGDEKVGENEQQVPMGDLTSAEQADEDARANGSITMTDPNSEDGLMTKEEALKMLQAVRDNDMLRRLKRQHQERSRHIPVERDW